MSIKTLIMNINKDFSKLLSASNYNDELLLKINEFRELYNNHESFIEKAVKLKVLELITHNRLGNHSYVLKHIQDVLPKADNSDKSLLVLIKIKSLVAIGREKEASSIIKSNLIHEENLNHFNKLDLFYEMSKINNLDNIEPEIVEIALDVMNFIGYRPSENKTLRSNIIELFSMNKTSNKKYGEIILEYFQTKEEAHKKKILKKYLESEPLNYYREMAKKSLNLG